MIDRTRFVACLIAMTGLTFAGCGRTSTNNPGAGGTPAPAAAQASASTNQVNPLSRDKVKDGGRLLWPIEEMPVTWNYNFIDGTENTSVHSKLMLMPAFFRADAGGSPHWDPNYLASEPIVVSDPKQIITYDINPKASWYDGTPITWQDFYWQWRALNGTNKAYNVASTNGYSEIENVARGKDDREVVVTFKSKYADWQPLFGPLYPASTNKSPQVFNEGWKARPLTTAGPFKFGSADQTAKTVTLVRNEKWWGEPAKLDEVVFRMIDPDAQVDAVANGELDLVDIGPDANKYVRAKAIQTAELRFAGGPNFRHLTINGTSPVLSDVKVRQAIAMAIDRNAIARAMLAPLGMQANSLGNHIYMANQNGYKDNSGVVAFNPQRAAQLLDEAGWTLDGNLRKKNGRVLEINDVIPAGVTVSRQESELMQNMLAQVGVKMNINTVPSQDFFEKYVTPGQFDFTVFAWMGTPYPVSASKSLYAKPTVGATGDLLIQQNYARVGSDEIDQLFVDGTRELDRSKQIDIGNKIDALLWQEVHSLTLYQRPDIWVVKKGLANAGAYGFADLKYEDIGWAK